MPTMIYKTADGKRVPSVTTINKIGQETGGLIHWAWQLGVDGLDYRNVRDDAAEAGNIGHALADAAIKNFDMPDLSAYDAATATKGRTAYGAFREWLAQSEIKFIASEWACVSERWRYGGCADAITQRPVFLDPAAPKLPTNVSHFLYGIGDWKSGALYPDHLCQIAAYANMWTEQNPDKPIKEFHLCRFNKDTGAFTHHYETDLSDAWTAFKLKRELYDLLATLKKRV